MAQNLIACVALAALSGCVARVHRRDANAPEKLVGGMPWFPRTEEAVRSWVAKNANARNLSFDLAGDPPYVETALDASSPVPRIGFFFLKQTWGVGAVLYWLPSKDKPPAITGERAGALWGMPLYPLVEGPELYAPDAHLLVRLIDSRLKLPERPRVDLPGDVRIKTPTLTFHRDLLFAVSGGRIWFKRNPALDGTLTEPWRLFGDGLPAPRDGVKQFDRPERIAAISADGDDLLAVDDRGRAYLCTAASHSLSSVDGWDDGWGFPSKRPLFLDGRAAEARAFAIGRRAEHALYFEDAIGNPHHFGPMGTTTFYVLHRDGSELLFTDNGLPNDFSRELCGPDDGRFVAESLSASASAIFLIDRYGRLATRFEDYDLNGGTPNFEYTYRSVVRADDDPASLASSLTPYFLPLPPWKWHAPPTLAGGARLSTQITVLQTGTGNSSRELRVAGLGPDGALGYYAKGIDQAQWSFVPHQGVALDPSRLLDPQEVARGAADYRQSGGDLAQSALPRAKSYRAMWSGTLVVPKGDGAEPVSGVSVIMDWNPYCPPARMTFFVEGGAFPATLHTVDFWTPAKRGRPGFDGTPLLLLGTLVLDDAVLADMRPSVRDVVKLLRPYHHANFAFVIAMDSDRVEIRAVDEGPGKKHPLGWSMSRTGKFDPPEPTAQTAEARGTLAWLRGGEVEALVDSPELLVDGESVPLERLRGAIEANEHLRQELRAALTMREERTRAVEEFQERWRFVAPLVPLGRVPLLPKLLSLDAVGGRVIATSAETDWKAIDERIRRRLEGYAAALARRASAPGSPR